MKKMKNLVLLSISLFVAFVFAACSADSEDGMGANGMNEFSAEEHCNRFIRCRKIMELALTSLKSLISHCLV